MSKNKQLFSGCLPLFIEWMNQCSDGGFCRTAPATRGLLNMVKVLSGFLLYSKLEWGFESSVLPSKCCRRSVEWRSDPTIRPFQDSAGATSFPSITPAVNSHWPTTSDFHVILAPRHVRLSHFHVILAPRHVILMPIGSTTTPTH